MDKVIIFVSDDNYINHVKSVAVNCIEQGKYDLDFAVICPTNSNAAKEFKSYGWNVLEVEATGFLQKFSVFDGHFKNYTQALYLDCDIIVQDDLSRLFQLLERDDKVIWMDTEDGDTMRTLPVHNREEEKYKELYDYVKKEYPHIYNQTFNSAFILFNPNNIPDGTVKKLMEIQETIKPLNDQSIGGTDQQTINLLLWHKCKKIPEKLVCFWGLAEPENDVDSEFRQYKKGDIPVAIHFSRWYAEWIEKKEGTGAYWNHRLNESNYNIYHRNLKLFNEKFSKSV